MSKYTQMILSGSQINYGMNAIQKRKRNTIFDTLEFKKERADTAAKIYKDSINDGDKVTVIDIAKMMDVPVGMVYRRLRNG